MEGWVQWGVGLAFTGLTIMVGYMINALRALKGDTERNHKDLDKKHSETTRDLHAKIDGVKDNYVRRDDFAAFRTETKADFENINSKLDRLLTQTKH
jgi:hypothetical protein